jgi:hypothetical protein
MKPLARTLFALAVVTPLGCSSADTTSETASSEEDLTVASGTTHPPTAFLLQYIGTYHSDREGEFDALDLRRDGSFIATVDGQRKTGRYEGPSRPTKPLKIAFILHGDSFTGTITGDWNTVQHLTIGRGATEEVLTSSWRAGAEDLCDDSGGTWLDDDPDPETGLYCRCPSTKEYIPSAGGCTN